MSWQVRRTESFDKWWKKENIEDKNYEYHAPALAEFQNIPLPDGRQHLYFRNTSYECWSSRLPDKVRQKGKSGGFRIVFVLDLEERLMLLQGIFRRDNLGWKGSNGKYDDQYDSLVKDLANEFVEAKISE